MKSDVKMCKTSGQEIATIKVNIENVTLTPLSCACLVNEIIKCLVYQKSQIPYPYNWLKCAVKRRKVDDTGSTRDNFRVQRHFQAASSAYDALEQIMSHISSEFADRPSAVSEVLILFGTTPLTPKEAYTLRIPKVAAGHVEANHKGCFQKSQHKILREIFLSDTWSGSMQNLPSTNMYVLLCKEAPTSSAGSSFVPSPNFSVPPNVKNVVVEFGYEDRMEACCRNLKVFDDDDSSTKQMDTQQSSDDDSCTAKEGVWYQSQILLRGFKDCFINKVSVSEMW